MKLSGRVMLIVAMSCVGCAAGIREEAPSAEEGGGGGDGGSGGGLSGLGGTSGSHADCATGTESVYLIGEDAQLFRFDPSSLSVSLVGTLACPTSAGTPFSMAVARDGYAWVEYTDGRLYRVDIGTAECVATDFVPGQLGFASFGMGMIGNEETSKDTFYVADYGGLGLATLDRSTLKLQFVGAYDTFSGPAELTGTADGRLYGFFSKQGLAVVAELDPTNAAILSKVPQPVDIGVAWAFAFWGGDFYLFTSPDGGPSNVDRFRPSDGTTTFVMKVPSVVIGAGVSTCAPLTVPE
ncbi:MAG: hypothetical protein KC731_13490 [Myxococcales bacterium]|nr:hypothetical protein [Myxococcales bacterium]